LHRLANPAYLRGFLCFALPSVAPYCVPGGIKVVSIGCGSGAGAFTDQSRRVKLRRSMSLVSSALPGAAPALRLGTIGFSQAATLSSHSLLSRAVRVAGSSTKNAPPSMGKLTRTSAPGYRSAAISTARGILCACTDTLKREAPSRIRIETLTISDHFLSLSTPYSPRTAT
jgi:hypothetical protein